MQETWRWFGPTDSVTLKQIVQAGATGIVTALHHIPVGEEWPVAEIKKRKNEIESYGLHWSVIESIPLHNDIKLRQGNYKQLIKNYQRSLLNVGATGIGAVCYNFMPVVDWTRTNLSYSMPSSTKALRFEMTDFVAYDLFMLERPNAQNDYERNIVERAKSRYEKMSEAERDLLEQNIIAGLPGGEGSYNRNTIRETIHAFSALGTDNYRENLFAFLREVVPFAEEANVKLCIHPDDPPFSLFGLPRVVSTACDARAILAAAPSANNGLTMCAGSFGARADNDLVQMVNEFAAHIFFVHLRNVKRESDGSFYESEHLNGDNDMIGLISALLNEERNRAQQGDNTPIPMRPDHGHLMDAEEGKQGVNPGYSYAGRMKALAELRGVIYALGQVTS